MKNDAIELIVVTSEPDKDGFEQETQESMECMAEIRSIRSSEFYQAAHEGIAVRIAAVVNLDDWDAAAVEDESGRKLRPSLVRYDGTEYRIVRDYKSSKTKVELTLQEVE